jgi:hypothetical protein
VLFLQTILFFLMKCNIKVISQKPFTKNKESTSICKLYCWLGVSGSHTEEVPISGDGTYKQIETYIKYMAGSHCLQPGLLVSIFLVWFLPNVVLGQFALPVRHNVTEMCT